MLGLWDPFKPTFNAVMGHVVYANTVFLGFVVVVAFITPFLALNSRLYFVRSKLYNAELEIASMTKLLENSERMRMTDVVTDIPNQEQFFYDLEKISQSVTYTSPFYLIFIDLDGFGAINERFGYATGDDLIRYFATSISETMRRNESIYKMPFDEAPDKKELWQRAYRKHTGGDEFLFVLAGDEADALGFLVRLQRRIEREMNEFIQTKILKGSDWTLAFSAAIIPIYPNDNEKDLFQRAHEGMRVARQPGSKSRVFWSSKLEPSEMEEGWRRKAYDDAKDVFKRD